jgi:trk system potassium uptake protein TrkA
MAMQKYCVIGLGYFGLNLCLYLADQGAEVIAVDINPDRVSLIKDKVSMAVEVDSTDAKALKSLGINDMDAVIVAIGEGFEASIHTTAILQEIGVQRILARVISPVHERLLKLMKIEELLVPEAEAARHLANRLKIPGLIESFEIGNQYGIFEIKVPPQFVGQRLLDINLRKEYKLNLVTVKKIKKSAGLVTKGEASIEQEIKGILSPEYVFTNHDILILFGVENDIKNLIDRN